MMAFAVMTSFSASAQTITKTADLSFGKIVRGSTKASVTVAANGARTCRAPLICVGAVTSARFTVTGTDNRVVTISVGSPITVTSPTGGQMDLALTRNPATLTLKSNKVTYFSVGGTLTVKSGQSSGQYSGTYTVTVNYQ